MVYHCKSPPWLPLHVGRERSWPVCAVVLTGQPSAIVGVLVKCEQFVLVLVCMCGSGSVVQGNRQGQLRIAARPPISAPNCRLPVCAGKVGLARQVVAGPPLPPVGSSRVEHPLQGASGSRSPTRPIACLPAEARSSRRAQFTTTGQYAN